MSSKRMTANPVKAPRYRPGKAVPEENSDSDSDASEDHASPPSPEPAPKATPKYSSASGISSKLSKVDLAERRKAAAAAEAARVAEEAARRAAEEEGFVTEESEEEADDSAEESEEGSPSEEEESEDEAPRRVMIRPTFIKKDKRKPNGIIVDDAEAQAAKAQAEEDKRKLAADEIVEEQIRKDLAAKAAGKKNWDDEEENEGEVDDTDDLDPEAELAAWKLRELKRIKRDRELIEEREREREEIERRKNLTEEERKAEDDQHIAKQKEEKDGKGKMSYMQKYYHKGAFFQDDAKAEGLDRRDIMGSRFADDVQNRELLPQALQMRDMTKLGKKGATKYKDLKSEDTGRWAQFDDRRSNRDGLASFGGDERFMPDRDRGTTGANNLPLGERKKVDGAPDGPRSMQWDNQLPRENGARYTSVRRSRSRSPRRDRHGDDRGGRKRSTSRDARYLESDKRRRVEST